MVELNQRDRVIRIKLVYYGPPVGGKTTNLRVLHRRAAASRRGELISVNSAQDRTILFDFMPLKTSGFRGFDVRLQLVAVPGQVMYGASRRVALKATDGVVFVANSALDRFEENLQSFAEMQQYLQANSIDPTRIPLVLQYNKRDLPEVLPIESLETGLNKRRVPAIPAIASRGEGVLETFSAILRATIEDLSTRFRTISLEKGQTPQEWVAQTVLGLFGGASLGAPAASAPAAVTPPAPEPPDEHRRLRIALAEDAPRLPLSAAQHAKMQESLAESYAEASVELSAAAAEFRDERDVARRRLDQLRRALDAGEAIAEGREVEASMRTALDCLAESGGAEYVSLLLPGSGAVAFRAVPRPPLVTDPLLGSPNGLRLLEELRDDTEPQLVRAEERPEVERLLEDAGFGSVALVPLRAPQRLLGFVALYYPFDSALPGEEAFAQIALLGRALRAALELVSARRPAHPN
jgi:signal recognition particle receptor subunit beta